VRLTKADIEAARHHGRPQRAHYLWDDQVRGLGVRVYPSGAKSFVVTYYIRGRQRFQILGRFGRDLTLPQARKRAQDLRGRVCRGEDPNPRAGRNAPTVADLFERYMAEHARPKMKPSSAVAVESLWRVCLLPRLARRKVADLAREDVERLHAGLLQTPVRANRALAVLSKACNLAEVWGWRPEGTNPCRHVKKYREEKRERFLTSDELARLGRVLAEAERDGSERPEVVAAIRLLLLTGCRLGEVLNLTWEEVDAERRCLRLGDSKTGKKVVHLNTAALEVLAGLPRSGRYVIPGTKPDMPLDRLETPWSRLRKRADLENLRIHDLRHTFASTGAGAGLSLPIIGRLLGHTQIATTQRYSHLADDPVRRGVETIGATIEAAMKGRPKAEVVPMTEASRPASAASSPA
jgi:integrase